MNSSDNTYCRLCAELKHMSKLYNLQEDYTKCREIVEKLERVNAVADFCEDKLPRTVCFECSKALDRAFEFVVSVEQAQTVLNSKFIIEQVKEETYESTLSEDENFNSTSPADLKEENDDFVIDIKEEANESDSNELERNDPKCITKHFNKNSDCEGIDQNAAIPQSQVNLIWKHYNWKCAFCGTKFESVDELTSHSMQNHNCCHAFQCLDCSKRKLTLDGFIIHVKSHRKYLKLSCYKCHKTFSTSRKLNAHVSEHKLTENSCPGCNTTFLTMEECDNHVKAYCQPRKRGPVPKVTTLDDLTCDFCKKTFKIQRNLNTHLLTHTERKRNYICDKCGKSFLNKQGVVSHMQVHDDVRPFKCKICKATFKRNTQLRLHVGVHDTSKPFACEHCGRRFRLKNQLTSHNLIHTDALPYVCSYCNKRFRFKTILYQHKRQHTGVKPYSCQICTREFTNWPNYNKHMKRRHNMDMAKKKQTLADSLLPIDPNTGEIIVNTETSKLLEWKKEMMIPRRPGRQKPNIKLNTVNAKDPKET